MYPRHGCHKQAFVSLKPIQSDTTTELTRLRHG
jgi:hypothetical protein